MYQKTLEALELRLQFAVTASFVPETGVLEVLGDALDNNIIVSRNAAGSILINGGTVPVIGGGSTVANTTQIQLFGQDGNDNIIIDETNGALPAASLVGDNGNDTLTGGSSADIIIGDDGDDVLIGKGGFDQLAGGNGNDSLTGGAGADQVFGQFDNDRLIWNPGDGSDLNEGGDGIDTVEVNGSNSAEAFLADGVGNRVLFERLDNVPFSLDIGATENLVLNANGGDDSFFGGTDLAGMTSFAINGGDGNDTLVGTDGDDRLSGDDGIDFLDGNAGADIALLGAGDDFFRWDPGDGSDTVEGQAGTDTMIFNGSDAAENFRIAANGNRVGFFRSVVNATPEIPNVLMDLNDVERIDLNALGGSDATFVNDQSATSLSTLNLNLGGSIGGGDDGQPDSVVVTGTVKDDFLQIASFDAGASITAAGTLFPFIRIVGAESTTDRLIVNTLDGNDGVDAGSLAGNAIGLVLNGGAGNDELLAGGGNDVVNGGPGNDKVFLQAGDDTFVWNPGDGSDTVEGESGVDTMLFNGNGADENINISPNGQRLRVFRDVGSVTMDVDGIEAVNVHALGGVDTITVNELTGTAVTEVNVDLESDLGTGIGDGQADAVVIQGNDKQNNATVADIAERTEVLGLAAKVTVAHADVTSDTLHINTLGDTDVISVNQTGTAGAVRRVLVDAGTGGDRITVNGTALNGAATIVPSSGLDDVDAGGIFTGFAAVNFEATQQIGNLAVQGGGIATLTGGGAKVLTTSSLLIGGSGRLNLTDNNMIIDYFGASPIATIQSLLQSGFNAGAWNGAGIVSSIAAAQTRTGIGFAEASSLFAAFPATFKGQSIDSTSLLLSFTFNGDANLNGAVDIADFAALATNFNQGGRVWSQGDFDYNGQTDIADFAAMSANFGQSAHRGIFGLTPILRDRILSVPRDNSSPIGTSDSGEGAAGRERNG